MNALDDHWNEDRALFDRATRLHPELNWRQLDAERLRYIAMEHGIDCATAMLYDRLCNSAEHGEFIRQVNAGVVSNVNEPSAVVIVPGAFYRDHNHTGADGQRMIELARSMNWPAERIKHRSFGSLDANAEWIVRHLSHSRASRIVIVSLSKGSAEVAVAMRRPDAADGFKRVVGWVSLSGIVTGTALVGWLRAHRLRTMGVHLLLWMRGQRFAVVDELRRDPDGPLGAPVVVPSHVRAIHVMGFPLRQHLRHRWSPRGYDRISPQGPTDGGGILLGDASRMPGLIYPVWGADHYLDPAWDVIPTLRALLYHAAASQIAASAIPASRSSA